jgi:hypothetical protein
MEQCECGVHCQFAGVRPTDEVAHDVNQGVGCVRLVGALTAAVGVGDSVNARPRIRI